MGLLGECQKWKGNGEESYMAGSRKTVLEEIAMSELCTSSVQ